jgi:hypothetical protein
LFLRSSDSHTVLKINKLGWPEGPEMLAAHAHQRTH